jgi:hypothetical protein
MRRRLDKRRPSAGGILPPLSRSSWPLLLGKANRQSRRKDMAGAGELASQRGEAALSPTHAPTPAYLSA